MYCIKCNQHIDDSVINDTHHMVPMQIKDGDIDFDFCDGDGGELITSCPAPEIRDDWDTLI